MKNKIYTGIGSRATPNLILEAFKQIGKKLGERGFTLRSGRAEGADSYFEIGARSVNGKCDIYIPWHGFTGNTSLDSYPTITLPSAGMLYERAKESVIKYHPASGRLTDGTVKLMARNYLQIWGHDINNPVLPDFIICWTKDGKDSGGTGQALRIAADEGVKVFNAFGYEHEPEKFVDLVMDYVNKEYT